MDMDMDMNEVCIKMSLQRFLEGLDRHGVPYVLREVEKEGLFVSKGDIIVEGVFPLKFVFSNKETEDGKQMAYGVSHYAEGLEQAISEGKELLK